MKTRHVPAVSVVLLATLALIWGCGGDTGPSGPNGDDDDQPGDRFYVDSSYAGVEEGTEEHPYNTIEEGIAAASRGDIVVLAPGAYGSGDDVAVPRVMTIVGAGAGVTILDGRLMVEADADTLSVIVKRLSCDSVSFWGSPSRFDRTSEANETPLGGARTEFAPILVDSCTVVFAGTGHPPDHSYTIQNSTVTQSIHFDHGWSDAAVNTVRACAVAESVCYQHGGGATRNTLEDCTIGARVVLRSGTGCTYSIQRNTCYGIYDSNGGANTVIAYNTLPTGDIIDVSGALSGEENEFIEYNVLEDGRIELESGNVTVRYNTVTTTATEEIGIDARSGYPTNIIGNTVTVPYGVPLRALGDSVSVGIRLVCGDGVVTGNVVTGGAYGILDMSATSEISGNDISGAHHGVCISYSHAEYYDNTVTDCVGDGMVVAYSAGPLSNNIITDNGGAGIRLFTAIDLGGGADGSTGGNTITGNAGYDLYVEVPADSAAVIYAEVNTWDHSTEGEIDTNDIYDVNDDPSLSDVDFMPLGD